MIGVALALVALIQDPAKALPALGNNCQVAALSFKEGSLMAEKTIKYKQHRIVVPTKETAEGTVSIDNQSFKYGRDAAGKYYLSDYAYDRDESLVEVVKRYLDHQERRAKARQEFH